MLTIDLNLLRVLDVMLEERSVTRAAARLGLTQSAVSHALNRLRYALGDELFIRGSAGMQPTPRAQDMGSQVHAALAQLQAALAPSDFDASTSDRRFTLAAGSYPAAILAPPLVSRLGVDAPMAELTISPYAADVFERMDAHRIDFMVGSVSSTPARFAREVLLTEDLAWVVRGDHPLARKNRIDIAALASAPQVVIAPPPAPVGEAPGERRSFGSAFEHYAAFDAALAGHGLTRRIGVTLPDIYSALSVVLRSDMTVLVPRRLVATAMGARFKLIEPPYEAPTAELALIYLTDRLVEPAVAWMRELIHETAKPL